jgi:pimeloyl-ACP methyl ester carboxylesterase
MERALKSRRLGVGPAVLLVHGGAGPEMTWERQEELAERWTLVVPWRRGYPPNPPVERQDWEEDAADLIALASDRPHLVGFSYGGVGAAVAVEREPERFRSLTLVEAPLWSAAVANDPEVQALAELSERFVERIAAGDSPPAEFLGLAGMARERSPRADAELDRLLQIARGMRSPGEAAPDLAAIGAALPTLVVSGDHSPGLERLCDAVAADLGAERAVIPGAGHAVPRAPGFNERLERFLIAAERRVSAL